MSMTKAVVKPDGHLLYTFTAIVDVGTSPAILFVSARGIPAEAACAAYVVHMLFAIKWRGSSPSSLKKLLLASLFLLLPPHPQGRTRADLDPGSRDTPETAPLAR